MNWLAAIMQFAEKLPIERLFVEPPSNRKKLGELQDILEGAHAQPAEAPPENPPEEIPKEYEDLRGYLEPRQQKVHLEPPPANGVSTEETVAYQNREIAKNLIVLEKHYAQKLTIAGKKCDCGAGRHLLAIESLAEETISMVDNPDVYYRFIDWVKEVSPKSTDRAAKSGQYDDEYPVFSRQARDFRKELIGSLEPAAMFDKKTEKQSETSQPEEVTELPATEKEQGKLPETQEITEEEFEKQRKDLLTRGIIT